MAERWPILLALALVAGCAAKAPVADCAASGGALVVELLDKEQRETGRIALALYADRESFDEGSTPLLAETIECAPGRCVWEIPELACGRFAIKAYRDLDDDGELDRGRFGAPSEPYGFSRDARGRFGPPAWDDAVFAFDGRARSLTIELR